MAELVWRGKSNPLNQQSAISQTQEHTTTLPPQRLKTIKLHLPENSSEQADTSPVQTEIWKNRLIWGNNHAVLPLLLREFEASINLIYIDPPFMTGRTFNNGPELAYKDTWEDLDTYLLWLYKNLVLLYKLLAPTGSLYVHLDWRVAHYVKIMLDEIFGFNLQVDEPGFKNEIIWHYQSGGRSQKHFARKHDTILFYTKSAHYCFHSERAAERRGKHKRNHMRKEIDADGHVSWTIRSAGRIYSYSEDTPMSLADVWSDISHLHQKDPERTGYATQKPAALLERIILTSSEEQDIVLDCFCGSGVTPVVAEQLGRRWIACDKGESAIKITRQRLLAHGHKAPFMLQELEEEK